MIGFEVLLNGTRLCTAAAGDDGVLTAIVTSVGKRRELTLTIGGLVEDAHLNWPVRKNLAIGDEVTVRVVQTDHPDTPDRTERDDLALVEEGERRYYERLKRKYEGQ